ncbi:Fc.00g109430.m01.CDS01 [Cosmosporella sp. VM-42]
MPPDPLIDEDEQYASSEDSDFAPDAVGDQVSIHSDSEDDGEKTSKKRSRPTAKVDAEDAGYDNSGDEAIIEKGKKRRKRAKTKGAALEDDEGGEGGLIKTRRQRAAEKEERKYTTNHGPVTVDVDAIWAQMLAGNPTSTKPDEEKENHEDPSAADTTSKPNSDGKQAPTTVASSDDPSAMIRIKRAYNFAGKVHTEEKLVARDSAEAKLYLASQGEQVPEDDLPAKRVTRKAFRSAFEPLTELLPQRGDLNLGMAARMQASKEAQAKKLNTVEKSRMDWAGYVDKEGIQDELALAGKSKDSYTAREDFLARSEARRDEDSRRVRLAGRV